MSDALLNWPNCDGKLDESRECPRRCYCLSNLTRGSFFSCAFSIARMARALISSSMISSWVRFNGLAPPEPDAGGAEAGVGAGGGGGGGGAAIAGASWTAESSRSRSSWRSAALTTRRSCSTDGSSWLCAEGWGTLVGDGSSTFFCGERNSFWNWNHWIAFSTKK